MTDLWAFQAVALALTVAVAFALLRSMTGGSTDDGRHDQRIYRDQLTEVDRDVARGTLPLDEADRLKTEISRRLLDAHAVDLSPAPARRRDTILGAIFMVIVLAAMLFVYLRIGAPGYPDLPNAPRIEALDQARATRPSQAEAESLVTDRPPAPDPQFADLVAQLRAAVDRNPTDLRGQQLLARNEAALGNYSLAAAAQRRAMDLQSETDADDHAVLAERLAQAAGGYISPEGEAALKQALLRDPRHPLALYLSGLMMAQGGREDLAFRDWTLALEVGAADAYWRPSVLRAMPDIARRAGESWTPPVVTPSPDASDVQALSALPEEERDAAIRGMVEGLATRLRERGGTAEEWSRLIRAYGVLGQQDEARAALAAAGMALTGRDLDMVRAAATQAGVVE